MRRCTHTILIAEDDPDDQELIAIAFAKADPSLKLFIVDDGQKALEYLQHSEDNRLPCLILLDYNMPELNGAQVIQKIASDERYQCIPKVILSTSGNPLHAKDSFEKGASAYHVKPDNFGALLDIAKEMAALCHKAAA